MTEPTVADELAWSALPEDMREQYTRVIREELAEELGQEGYNEGYADGCAYRRASNERILELVNEAEKWLRGNSLDVDCACDALIDLRKEVQ